MSAQLEDLYSLKLPLGRNLTGTVWHAEKVEGGQPVAVALLDLEDVNNDSLRKRAATRFRRDLSLLRQLDHPNVVRVLGVGRSKEGHPYAAMERLEGVSLLDWVDATPSGAERIRMASGVLEGLEAAHRSGVIHGDLEPGNVIVTAGDTPKLIAFGLNRALARQIHPGWQETSGVSRTLTYRAPEQAEGRGGRSVDIYGAGILLHLICSDELPENGASSLRESASRLPGGLVAVIERALHVDPAERHPSIAAMRKAWNDAASISREAVRNAMSGFRSDSRPPVAPADDESSGSFEGRPSLLSVGVALPEEPDEGSGDEAPAAAQLIPVEPEEEREEPAPANVKPRTPRTPSPIGRVALKKRAVPARVAAVEVRTDESAVDTRRNDIPRGAHDEDDLASVPPSRINVVAAPPPPPPPRTITERFSSAPPAPDDDDERISDGGRISLSDALEEGLFTQPEGEEVGAEDEGMRISLSDVIVPESPPKAAPRPKLRSRDDFEVAQHVSGRTAKEPSRSPLPWIVAACAVLGLGGWLATRPNENPETLAGEAHEPSGELGEAMVEESESGSPSATPEEVPLAPEAAVEEAPEEPREPAPIQLHGLVAGAAVTLDGVLVQGSSETVQVLVPQDGERHTISITHTGYTPWQRELVATGPLDLLVMMDAITPEPPPPSPAALEPAAPMSAPIAATMRAASTSRRTEMNAPRMNRVASAQMRASGMTMMTVPRMAASTMTRVPGLARDPGF